VIERTTRRSVQEFCAAFDPPLAAEFGRWHAIVPEPDRGAEVLRVYDRDGVAWRELRADYARGFRERMGVEVPRHVAIDDITPRESRGAE
jgi:hypothetical protein